MGLVDILPIARRRHGSYDNSSQSRRQTTLSYSVPDGKANVVKVCKKTFIDIFKISPQKISKLVEKKQSGVTIYKDKRGGAKNCKFTYNDRLMVRAHINLFPRDVSHYTRAKSDKEYLSPDLNISRLFKSFQSKNPTSIVTYKFYRKVFLKDFNLSFRKIRMDTCKKCDLLNLKTKSLDYQESQKAKKELELHHRKSEAAFQMMKSDAVKSAMPESDTLNVVMDLQKVFSIPKLSHSDMYYSRQLCCYNFGIHVSDTGNAIMCVWHEGQSGRGGSQMASCLFQALNSGVLSTHKKKLSVWSDNCAGQIKNRMLLFMYEYLVASGMFDEVEHKFLISGHSFSSADRDFAIIEKTAKNSKMETVEDVKKVIKSARFSKPFKVLDMTDNFFDFDRASAAYINTTKLGISKITWMKVTRNSPGFVFCKDNFSDLGDFKKNLHLQTRR